MWVAPGSVSGKLEFGFKKNSVPKKEILTSSSGIVATVSSIATKCPAGKPHVFTAVNRAVEGGKVFKGRTIHGHTAAPHADRADARDAQGARAQAGAGDGGKVIDRQAARDREDAHALFKREDVGGLPR